MVFLRILYDFVKHTRISCPPGVKSDFSARNSFSLTRYASSKISKKISVSGEQIIGRRCRASSFSVMLTWYKIWIFSQLFLLAQERLQLQNFSKNHCTRRTDHPRAMFCYLLDSHDLLIQTTNFQPAIPTHSRGISASRFFEKTPKQENS